MAARGRQIHHRRRSFGRGSRRPRAPLHHHSWTLVRLASPSKRSCSYIANYGYGSILLRWMKGWMEQELLPLEIGLGLTGFLEFSSRFLGSSCCLTRGSLQWEMFSSSLVFR
ncbi:uncharacterized protein [Triticum aestivum]|uniref:uncharacterized protein isoform X2 n=1 Tax=Triticum aestivum TaxID=4565 RepID=UPI001D003B5C|nr:uncharacterized protein LOC123185791 isoform X2 [Triticum aestivum]